MAYSDPPGPDRPLTVGALVRALREEFPDVSISKIRFLEAQGLLTPARTASGYRQFAAADVERARYVLRAQRDRFLPLRVIRADLDAIDRGLAPVDDDRPRAPEPRPDPAVPSAEALAARRRLRLTPAELAEASGLAPEEVAELAAHGLLHPLADGHHGEADLRVAQAVAGLAAHGFGARHLRPFRVAADREVGLVEQAVGSARDPRSRRAAAEVAHLCLTLHAALVRARLDDGADPAPHAGRGAGTG